MERLVVYSPDKGPVLVGEIDSLALHVVGRGGFFWSAELHPLFLLCSPGCCWSSDYFISFSTHHSPDNCTLKYNWVHVGIDQWVWLFFGVVKKPPLSLGNIMNDQCESSVYSLSIEAVRWYALSDPAFKPFRISLLNICLHTLEIKPRGWSTVSKQDSNWHTPR